MVQFHPGLVCVLENTVNKDEIIYLENNIKNLYTPQEGLLGGGLGELDKTIRKSQIHFLTPDAPNSKDFYAHVESLAWKIANQANRTVYGFNLEYLDGLQYTEYHAEDEGFYDWHHDWCYNAGSPHFHRKLSFTIQLSEENEYVGGNLEFSDFECAPKLMKNLPSMSKQGTTIIFPSFMQHRVSPVKQGIRKSLVAWFAGERLR